MVLFRRPRNEVLLIDRPKNQNIRDAFERQLGIDGKIPIMRKSLPRTTRLKTVVGTLPPLSAAANFLEPGSPS